MKRANCLVVAAGLTLIAAGASFAAAVWMKTFNDTYKPKGALKNAKCAICHIKDKAELNVYGKDLNCKRINAAGLRSIEAKDSDKDGFTNIKEIRAGTLPGDPSSKPVK